MILLIVYQEMVEIVCLINATVMSTATLGTTVDHGMEVFPLASFGNLKETEGGKGTWEFENRNKVLLVSFWVVGSGTNITLLGKEENGLGDHLSCLGHSDDNGDAVQVIECSENSSVAAKRGESRNCAYLL